jgi:hypothetical protein
MRSVRAAVMAGALGVSTGCYTSHSLVGAPDPGVMTVVTLNDRGRSALTDAVGQNADRVEGSVISRTDSGFTLAVRNVRYLGGEANEWRGEQVTVPVAGVRGLTERRFSKTRTYLLGGAVVAAFIAFIATRSLLGEDPTLVEEPGGGGQPSGSFLPTRP